MIDFKLPEISENVKSGTVVKIFVSNGDAVKKGQTLLELETEKASLEVPSPCDGTIQEILIKENQEVKIGQTVMKINDSGTPVSAAPSAPAPTAKSESAPSAPTQTPRSSEPVAPAAVSIPQAAVKSGSMGKDVPAAPSVRRLARELGIEISQVPGSGPSGRISKDDVKAFAKRLISGGMGTASSAPVAKPLPDFSKFGEIERKPMNNIRKKTAEHLTHCWQTIPHVTQFDKADVTDLDKLRRKYSTPERGLTITPFLLKVMASALKQFPQFNAAIDMATNEIVYKKYFHLGIAVDTDRGLLVPVIKNVDQKSIYQIADELKTISAKARDKKLTLDEMQGGNMTLTNLGSIGGTYFTPIVNWPEVSILGVSRGGFEPVWENDQFIPRMKLPLSLSYDHRLIDGADGARFLRWVSEALEQPFLMELENK